MSVVRCNAKFQHDFEYSFNMSATIFYDFPFHPLVLDHTTFLLYCKLAEQRTKCYVEQCKDSSADTVFSPSNFICSFKRSHFTEVRQCLADAEPITFLKCDHQCHDEVVRTSSEQKDHGMNQVFSSSDLTRYEKELGMLCSFQTCYLQCMIPIVDEVCVPEMAQKTVELVRSFIQWHATDISDWHAVAGRFEELPESCRQLAGVQPDPVLQLISRE
ncbi:hypothetical protein OESDEN_13988 [Oesophagostomum dentatum]|uniref:Chondroitin proteoglycan 4 domain-containing protein n=1 Tax=Oesophagostomum dentatum TaxID=61180 RepID=A0A0B1SQU6_OESDE|nr:hypothetical protein OESDEN_13988 [Oesophagostomum dentatum]